MKSREARRIGFWGFSSATSLGRINQLHTTHCWGYNDDISQVYGGIPSVVVFGVGNGDGGRRDLMEMVVVVIHYISMGLVMGLPTLLEIIIFFFSRRN